MVAELKLQSVSRLSPTDRLHLAIGLPLRNKEALARLLQQIYDPAGPEYRQYLTPEQFAEMFGPTVDDYRAVISFVTSNGLTVTATHPNRVLLEADGSVADVERMLHMTMRVYQHPGEARTFFAPDVEPSLDLTVPILHISGLNNYTHRVPHLRLRPAGVMAQSTPNAGSGPSGTYRGSDFRTAYVPGTTLTGAGQNVALVQFDGYYSNDIATYVSQAGISTGVILTNVTVGGYAITNPGSGNVEVALDIEMAISMAPELSKIIVYEATNNSALVSWATMLNRIATDNLAKQISCSWGNQSVSSPDPSSEQAFRQMAAQGQSFFNASGDSDAFTAGIPFPSESTNVTQVGGTTLTTGSGAAYFSETVWNWGGGTGSSGGVSTHFAIPPYQQGIDMTANLGSTTMRNVPDVALTADNVYIVYNNGSTGAVGGTSCAAPLWAGFTALVNQQAAADGLSPVGFLNPAVYTIGKGATYSNCFHDITAGNNQKTGSGSKFPATPGYDLCTGWGTPNGTNLINALAAAPTPIVQLSVVKTGAGTGTITSSPAGLNCGATCSAGFSTNSVVQLTAIAGTNSVFTVWSGAASGTNNPISVTLNTNKTVIANFDGLPAIATAGATLAIEGCTPANAALDPGETVSVNFALKNVGNATTANLVATLQATGGVTSPSGSQTYGALSTNGVAVAKPFTFTASGTCGGSLTATLQLQDGTKNLGTVAFKFTLGAVSAVFTENFDSVTAPTLPSGWTTSAGGAESSWVTSTTQRDTVPNAAFSPDPSSVGSNALVSPVVPIVSSSAQLTFRNNYSLEASSSAGVGYDGGVLEIRIGNGAFQDILAAGGSFVSGGYTRTISSSYSNPLAGRQAWSGSSGGFITTVVNLPSGAAGQNIQLRWRCGTDSSVSSSGWYIDSISISDASCCSASVNHPPVIIAASISPGSPSTTNDLIAAVTSASDADGDPITFAYQWRQSTDNATFSNIAFTAGTLPAVATVAGDYYRVLITPNDGKTNGTPFTTASVLVQVDANGNGINDDWEVTNFGQLGVNPNADPDGDGFSNLQEFLAGTDPLDSSSVLRITSITVSGSDVVIDFTTSSNKFYDVQYNDDLTLMNWGAVATNFAGTGAIVSVTDPGAAGLTNRFYRVRLLP